MDRHPRVATALAFLVIGCTACNSMDRQLQRHRQKLQSLGASAQAIGTAWTDGTVSSTYTGTALEQIYALVEQERSALAGQPAALADPRGAELSQAAERLSRLIAQLLQDVRGGDRASARGELAAIPVLPARQP